MISQFIARSDGTFSGMGLDLTCAIGKGGMVRADSKIEGDGTSPMGVWPMRCVYYRPDRARAPETGLDIVPLTPLDGWCDDPKDPLYNRPVILPYPASHEALWREDHVYDLIVALGHNDDPVISGQGSAVFLHVARPEYVATEGCIALSEPDLYDVLRLCGSNATLEIAP